MAPYRLDMPHHSYALSDSRRFITQAIFVNLISGPHVHRMAACSCQSGMWLRRIDRMDISHWGNAMTSSVRLDIRLKSNRHGLLNAHVIIFSSQQAYGTVMREALHVCRTCPRIMGIEPGHFCTERSLQPMNRETRKEGPCRGDLERSGR